MYGLAGARGHTDLLGIGVDTWGVDFGLVGKDNRLLGHPFAYRDSRTNGMMEKAFQLMPKDELYLAPAVNSCRSILFINC